MPLGHCVTLWGFQIFPFVPHSAVNIHMKKWHDIFPHSGKGKQMIQIVDWIREHRLHNQPIMDFGCGKGGTIRWLQGLYPDAEITGYDVGHPDYNRLDPQLKHTGIYSIDCWEHIELRDIAATIQLLRSITHPRGVWCHIIDLTPAIKQLPDGRNAHVTLLNREEWQAQFEQARCRIHQISQFSQPDPNFGERVRLCIQMSPHPVNTTGRPHKNL